MHDSLLEFVRTTIGTTENSSKITTTSTLAALLVRTLQEPRHDPIPKRVESRSPPKVCRRGHSLNKPEAYTTRGRCRECKRIDDLTYWHKKGYFRFINRRLKIKRVRLKELEDQLHAEENSSRDGAKQGF